MGQGQPTYAYLDAATESLSRPGPTVLHSIIVGTPLATAVVVVYHGTDATGDLIATIDAASKDSFDFERLLLKNGLFVRLDTANAKVTVLYE